MRYGLNRLPNLFSGVFELASRTEGRGFKSHLTDLKYINRDAASVGHSQHRLTHSIAASGQFHVPHSSSAYRHDQFGRSPSSPLWHNPRLSWLQCQHRQPVSLCSSQHAHPPHQIRHFSLSSYLASTPEKDSSENEGQKPKSEDSKGLMHRFHKAYKAYGPVLIGFHCVTYCMYFTTCFGISYAGLDVMIFLEWLRDHASLPQVSRSSVYPSLTASLLFVY